MQIGEANTLGAWRIGDIATNLMKINEMNGGKAERMQVYDAVGFYSKTPARTVRYYARVATFFGPEARNEFSALTFSHFDAACGREDWYDMLDYAIQGFEKIGKPYSVEALKKKFIYSSEDWVESFDDVEKTEDYSGDYGEQCSRGRDRAEKACDEMFMCLYDVAGDDDELSEKLENFHIEVYNIIDEAFTK